MSFSCGFYNSENGDREYFNEDLSNFFDGLVEDGIYAFIDDHLLVKASETPDMNINVSPGRAWFNSTWTRIDAMYPVKVPAADAVQNRIDAVCLTINKTRAVRDNYIEIISGPRTTGTPTKPEVTNETNIYRYVLAYVTVNHGTTAITQASIENHIGMEGCPFSKPVWQNIPSTDEMVAQWQTQFDEFMTYIHNTFDYDAAGNLQTQLSESKIGVATVNGSENISLANIEDFHLVNGSAIMLKIVSLPQPDNGSYYINVDNTGRRKLLINTTLYGNGGIVLFVYNYTDQEWKQMPTMGIASESTFGYVKLSDTYNEEVGAAANGIGASQHALYSMRQEMRSDFQAGVDAVYNACVAEGVTPSASTPTAIAQAIAQIRNGGDATAAQILSGKKAYSAKNFITGTMANRGNWTGATSGAGNVAIPAGYHAGGGYVSGAGAYNAGYNAARSYAKSIVTQQAIDAASSNYTDIVVRSGDRLGSTWRGGDDTVVTNRAGDMLDSISAMVRAIQNW